MSTQKESILFVVDPQIDFIHHDGALAIPDAEEIKGNLKTLVRHAQEKRVRIIYTADAHKPHDPEMEEQGGPFPHHCMAGSPGQALISEVVPDPQPIVIPNSDEIKLEKSHLESRIVLFEKQSYDMWDNPHLKPVIKEWKPSEVVVCGVATDYCVKAAVMGLRKHGFSVALVTDAIKAVDPEEGKKSLDEMVSAGARLVSTEEALKLL